MRYRTVQQPGSAPRRCHRDLRRKGDPAHVVALEIDLRLRDVHSLKEKRSVVRPIIEGAARRFSVAAAEVGHQDSWQRSTLGVAAVSGSASHAREVMDAVERFVWSFPEVEVISVEREWL